MININFTSIRIFAKRKNIDFFLIQMIFVVLDDISIINSPSSPDDCVVLC